MKHSDMRRLCLIAAAALLAACQAQKPRTGDLVFIGIPAEYNAETGSMDEAIVAATGRGSLNIIHAAILEMAPEGPMIIDATLKYGVDRHPLDSTIAQFTLGDGSQPVYIVKRLKKGFKPEFIDNAKAFCGRSYDLYFLPENEDLYCTELIQRSYTAPDGLPIFPSQPMNFKNKDGEFPHYWNWLFGLLGMDIPQGLPGTNPQDMMDSPVLKTVNCNLLDITTD